MEYRFNRPPSWPAPPPGWRPPPGWQPDPSWPRPPRGWRLWVPVGLGPSGATLMPDVSEQPEASAACVRPHCASGADMISRGQDVLSRARRWFSGRSAWVKVLLVAVLIGLSPWLLLAAGLTITGIGLVGLRRGSVPTFRLSSCAAAGAVLAGQVTLGAGSALAASVIGSESSPARTPPPLAAPPRSSAASTTPTPSPPATTARPTAPIPRVTVAPRRPTRTLPPAPRPRTPKPTARPAPPLTVTIIGLLPTGQGNVATASAQTAPRADCSIEVEYKSGPSTARGLNPKTASGAGAVTWSWIVGSRTTPGSWPVTVSCSRGGQSETTQRFLMVLDTGKPG